MPHDYNDILLGYSYFGNCLKAIRVSKNYEKMEIKHLKNLFKNDSSVKNINVYNIDKFSSIISMNVDSDNTFLDRLIKQSIYPLKSSVHCNNEEYIFMLENAKAKTLFSSFKDDHIKINSIRNLKPEEVIPAISNFITDIYLTPREKNVIKIAIDNNFFNIPRGTTNTELAKDFNISKMSMNIEIRKATNKIMKKCFLK